MKCHAMKSQREEAPLENFSVGWSLPFLVFVLPITDRLVSRSSRGSESLLEGLVCKALQLGMNSNNPKIIKATQ